MTVQTEAEVVQRLLPDLQAEGYEVYFHPGRPLLPEFLAGYVPDAIALRSDRNLAIEVVRESANSSKKLEQIAPLFAGQKKWELRVVWLTPAGTAPHLETQTPAIIRNSVAEVRDLADRGYPEPAFLLAWATFEALARILRPGQFEGAQTPARLVQFLATEGHITPNEADQLRALMEKRNKLIHGELQIRVSPPELDGFLTILDALLEMTGSRT